MLERDAILLLLCFSIELRTLESTESHLKRKSHRERIVPGYDKWTVCNIVLRFSLERMI